MKKSYKSLKNKPILFFFTFFIFSFLILLIISNLWLNEKLNNFHYNLFRTYFIEKINKNLILKREINTSLLDNYLNIRIIFYDKQNNVGSFPVKNISINLFTESTLLIILTISLCISIPVFCQRKLISSIIALIIVNLFILFKIYAFVIDNYSNPDLLVLNISFPTKQIIYYFNKLFTITGFSLNYVIVVVIFFVSSIRIKDLDYFADK